MRKTPKNCQNSAAKPSGSRGVIIDEKFTRPSTEKSSRRFIPVISIYPYSWISLNNQSIVVKLKMGFGRFEQLT